MLSLAPLLATGPATAAPAAAVAPSGGIGIRLLDVPKNAVNDPRAREYIIDDLAPGTTIHRRVVVSNSTATQQHVSLYAGGAAIMGDAFVPAEPNELSGWIQVNPAQLTLAPKAQQIATVSLTVPRDASAGERYATVWAQVSVPPSVGHPVTLVSRVGIRVYLEVGTGGAPRSDFTIGTITATPGARGSTTVRAKVVNTGQRAVDVTGSLSLASADGTIQAGPYRSRTALTLLPGSSGTSVVTVAQALPAGPWDATLTLSSGLVSHTVTGRIAIGTASSLSTSRDSGLSGLDIGLIVGGGLLVLAGSGIGASAFTRRRRGAVTS